MRTIEIKGADGLKLVADEWGDPSGPPVLMCHGAGQNRYAWKSSAEILAQRGWFVTTLDARGHGDSDWSPDHKYDSEDIGRDIAAVLSPRLLEHRWVEWEASLLNAPRRVSYMQQ